jgi:hypothetical protein
MWGCGRTHTPTYSVPPLAVDLFSVDSLIRLSKPRKYIVIWYK